ncbi:type IV secretion protein Rhs [Pseudomonas syringae]|nr:type IV secretion protein Rhs [Pseudomonas syringae]MBD8788745.1 type IV secretion protein Rhs [Pseudomonas syringae]MBD8811252.1 type IV secretion protein Rhs [Pseudomonas syringae]
MPDSPRAPRFRLEVAGLRRHLAVVSFRGREAISQPYAFTLDVLCDTLPIALAQLMYRSAFLTLGPDGAGVHGQIQAVARAHYHQGPVSLRISLGPRLTCLAQRQAARVFQQMSAPQIIARVLSEHGLLEDSYRFELKSPCAERAFCAQYRENDLQFIQRLCAEEGIHYHFVHSRHHHDLIFGSGLHGARRTPEAPWRTRLDMAGITRFTVSHTTPCGPDDRVQERAEGHSTLAFVHSGHLLALTGHARTEWNHLWRITHVEHRGASAYGNRFVALPWEVGISVPPVPAEDLPALQRAWLVGPPGQAACRDAAGRVQVQFEWGLQGQGARFADCWLPVDAAVEGALQGGQAVLVAAATSPHALPRVIGGLEPGRPAPGRVAATPPRVQARLDSRWLLEEDSVLQVEQGPRLHLAPGAVLVVQVGASEVRLDAHGLSLDSPALDFAVSAQEPAIMAAQAPGDTAQAHPAQQGEQQEGQP